MGTASVACPVVCSASAGRRSQSNQQNTRKQQRRGTRQPGRGPRHARSSKASTTFTNNELTSVGAAAVLKALLVHAARWQDASELDLLPIAFKRPATKPNHPKLKTSVEPKNSKKAIASLFGYGVVESRNIGNCNGNRVTLVGGGDIEKDQAITHRIPVPASISPIMKKRVTVTLATLTPVNPRSARWRGVKLAFKVSGAIGIGFTHDLVRENDQYIVATGTVQHEVFEGERAFAVGDDATIDICGQLFIRRSRKVVLIAEASMKSKIRINDYNDFRKYNVRRVVFDTSLLESFDAVPYALVVSIEVAGDIDIYSEVALKLDVRTRIQVH
jgi:hypothetical protein